jgi:hypothetical protein
MEDGWVEICQDVSHFLRERMHVRRKQYLSKYNIRRPMRRGLHVVKVCMGESMSFMDTKPWFRALRKLKRKVSIRVR